MTKKRWLARFAAGMLGVAIGVMVTAATGSAQASPALTIVGDDWREYQWRSYDYDGGRGSNGNFFLDAERTIDTVAVDDSGWRIDTPESPDSVLAILTYTHWTDESPDSTHGAPTVSLQDRVVRFDIRGVGLDLRGGEATFWTQSNWMASRFHHTAHFPIAGEWETHTFRISADEPQLWHQSWNGGGSPVPLAHHLQMITSWGIGFVGFDGEPAGRLELRNFEIVPAGR